MHSFRDFGIFVGFIFPTVHVSERSRSYNDYTTPTEQTMRREAAEKNWTSILKRKEIINNGNITDYWKPVHYLKIHVHCVGSARGI
jgi:hypothetical protein